MLVVSHPRLISAGGVDCGVVGSWAASGAGAAAGDGVSLNMRPAGLVGPNPAVGDITIAGVRDGDGVAVDVSIGAADNPAQLWTNFSSSGTLPGLASGASVAAVGAVALNGTVPAGGNVTLSFVLSWFFPDRNHLDEDIGGLRRVDHLEGHLLL